MLNEGSHEILQNSLGKSNIWLYEDVEDSRGTILEALYVSAEITSAKWQRSKALKRFLPISFW